VITDSSITGSTRGAPDDCQHQPSRLLLVVGCWTYVSWQVSWSVPHQQQLSAFSHQHAWQGQQIASAKDCKENSPAKAVLYKIHVFMFACKLGTKRPQLAW
jgi:hypothetical protein